MKERSAEQVPREYNDGELRALGDELAHKIRTGIELKDAKAAAVADYGAKLKQLSREIADLSDKIALGYELVEVEVMVMYDHPKPGEKSILRLDTNAVIRTESMTERERQRSFGFEREDERPES